VFFVAFVSERAPSAGQATPPAQTQAQQRPVFRGGTHFVRVDAYPTTEDGKIAEGLKPEDFEILEDGKPQAIDSFDFIRFDTFSTAERRNPSSQRESFDLAADPRYRVFVVYGDMTLTRSSGSFSTIDDLPKVQQPLVDFFERVIGPRDLYGFLTSRNSVKDLVLSQKTDVTIEQIRSLYRVAVAERDDADAALDFCGCFKNDPVCDAKMEALKRRHRADANYTNLRDIVIQLGSLRQERKNLVLVTNMLPRWPADENLRLPDSAKARTGIVNGRITNDSRNVFTNGGGNADACQSEIQRLAGMDFEPRYYQLFDIARRENVALYVIAPGGLQAPPSREAQRAVKKAYEDLESIAEGTGAIAIVDVSDLDAGFRRIADDMAAYYVLGYYTTNTKFDGRVRKLTVKVKGTTVRARREYRAPTEAEIAAMMRPAAAAPPPEPSGPPAVIGEPAAYRVSRAQPPEQVSVLEFARADRLRVSWPILAPLDRREAKLLDSAGKPLPIDLPLAEDAAAGTVVVELPLAPFGRGVYSLELTAASGTRTERRRLTFTMK
jgi:VWFA-related protein